MQFDRTTLMELPELLTLLGVPARLSMAWALVGGDALPASELAYRAGVTPQTASHHLARMVSGGLLEVERCLRYRYYRLASPAVAEMLENLLALSGPPVLRNRPDHIAVEPLRRARSCYDHLAGSLAVALADSLERKGWIHLHDRDYQVTEVGERGFTAFGLNLLALHNKQRLFARRCIDWSERRPHIGGSLGAALMTHFLASGWIKKNRGDRKVWVTTAGRRELWETFGVDA